jgi:hypothetical protein
VYGAGDCGGCIFVEEGMMSEPDGTGSGSLVMLTVIVLVRALACETGAGSATCSAMILLVATSAGADERPDFHCLYGSEAALSASFHVMPSCSALYCLTNAIQVLVLFVVMLVVLVMSAYTNGNDYLFKSCSFFGAGASRRQQYPSSQQ